MSHGDVQSSFGGSKATIEPFALATVQLYLRALTAVQERWRTENPVTLRSDVESGILDSHHWPLWLRLYKAYQDPDPGTKSSLDRGLSDAIVNLRNVLSGVAAAWPSDVLGEPARDLEISTQKKRIADRVEAHGSDTTDRI